MPYLANYFALVFTEIRDNSCFCEYEARSKNRNIRGHNKSPFWIIDATYPSTSQKIHLGILSVFYSNNNL